MTIKTYAKTGVATALLFISISPVTQVFASSYGTADNDLLLELKRMIEQQQVQLDRQSAEIAKLKEQLAGNTESIGVTADKEELADVEKMATSSFSNVNVSLYGQFNPAILAVNNGDSSDFYVVDNTHSQTRFGLKASVDTVSSWKVGGRLEYGITANASHEVNNLETYDASDPDFKLRWAQISFDHERFGKFSLGKGDSASNNSAEIDLSGTAVAMQDKTLWMASATYWNDGSSNTLSELRVKDLYNGYDGLSRTDRIRYDTPNFSGFSLAGSVSSGDAFDSSLWFSRSFAGTKIAAGIGAANPGDIMANTDMLYTGSASILFPLGVSATFSGGYKDLVEAERDSSYFWWAKLGYKTKFHESATTAFSIDYGEANNLVTNDERGKTWALAAVHDLSNWGTELYMIYRMYLADSQFADFDDVNTFMAGARLKF